MELRFWPLPEWVDSSVKDSAQAIERRDGRRREGGRESREEGKTQDGAGNLATCTQARTYYVWHGDGRKHKWLPRAWGRADQGLSKTVPDIPNRSPYGAGPRRSTVTVERQAQGSSSACNWPIERFVGGGGRGRPGQPGLAVPGEVQKTSLLWAASQSIQDVLRPWRRRAGLGAADWATN